MKQIILWLVVFSLLLGWQHLHAEPGDAQEQLVVVGSKTERPLWSVAAQVQIFEREQLDWQQLQDLSEITRYQPALETDFSGSRFDTTGLSIRGIGGNRVALEFDGVPLPQQLAVGSFADSGRLALDPEIIKRVEILHGPASALYGSDAIGGVVVITSVDGEDLVAEGEQHYFGAQAGYFGANDSALGGLTYAWAGQQSSLLLAASQRDGHERDNQARDVDSDKVDFSQQQLFAKWTHEFDQGNSLRASFDYFSNEVDSELRAQLGYERFSRTTQLTGEDEQTRERLALEYRFAVLDQPDAASLMIYTQENNTDQLTDEFRSSRTGRPLFLERDFYLEEERQGGEFKLRHDFDTGPASHVLVAGLEWDRQQLLQRREAQQTTLQTGATTNIVLGEVFPLRDLPKSTTDKTGVFIQDEIELGSVTLIPAVRWDQFDLDAQTDGIFTDATRLTDLEDDDLTYRFGTTWRVSDGISLYAHYAEGFRAPPAEDVNLFLDIAMFNVRAIPNPDLKPERSRNRELGIRLQKGGTTLQAGAYRSQYDDFIESRVRIGLDPASGLLLFQSRNIEKATIKGTELNLNQALGAFNETLESWYLDFGWHSARGDNDITGAPLNTVNPDKTVLGLRWDPSTLPVAVEFHATHYDEQSRVDFSDGDFFVPEAATVMDLVLRWDHTEQIQSYLGLYNLGDERYWRYADVRKYETDDPRAQISSQPGFNAAFTLRAQF